MANSYYFGTNGTGSRTSYDDGDIFQIITYPTGNLNLAGSRPVTIEGVTVDGLTAGSPAVYYNGTNWYVYVTYTGTRIYWTRYTAPGYFVDEAPPGTGWTDSSMNGTITWSTVASAPGTPAASRTGRDVTVTASSGSSSNGGSTITSYKVQYRSSSDGGSTWGTWGNEQTLSSLAYTYTGLTASLTYQFRVYANNARGSSAATVSTNVFVPAGGKRYNGSSFISTTTAKRWTGSAWTDLTTAKRWSGSAWVDLS